jgi:hypothetical protein
MSSPETNLYHITLDKYLPSIMVQGLLPDEKRGLSRLHDPWGKVFLTDWTSMILIHQAGRDWIRQGASVCTIDTDDLEIYQHVNHGYFNPWEWTVDFVPLKNIVAVDPVEDDEWKPYQVKRRHKIGNLRISQANGTGRKK